MAHRSVFGVCGQIDFQARDGEECLASNVADLLGRVQEKYDEVKASRRSFVMIRPMQERTAWGIMTVHDVVGDIGLNRKQRNKMSVVKEGLESRR